MFKIYNDLLIEIEMCKSNLKIDMEFRDKLIKELNPNAPHHMKGMEYDGMPKGSSNFTSLDRLYERNKNALEVIEKSIALQVERLESKEVERKKQEDAFRMCEGLYHKVFDLHRMQRKSLTEVAEILGYSYSYIKDINYQINKEIMNDK